MNYLQYYKCEYIDIYMLSYFQNHHKYIYSLYNIHSKGNYNSCREVRLNPLVYCFQYRTQMPSLVHRQNNISCCQLHKMYRITMSQEYKHLLFHLFRY
uniref:Uncharacterized protein n=1 Tax=Myoviridae sp. ctjz83 TaxID=2826083 RepID=A0A8D9PDX1_9CAUD|nr:MAG TPA: hypothetical protein [Myoviridae sp. ctjz83]